MLKQFLPPNQVEMPPYLRIFSRETFNVCLRE
jgi:hypothetical protein